MKPEELALKVDAFKAFRDNRIELQREVDKLKEEENKLKNELIALFSEANVSAIGGKNAVIRLMQKTQPVVSNWDDLYRYIENTGAFELLQRRLGEAAVKERWEDGVDVPGVTTETFYDLSVRKE